MRQPATGNCERTQTQSTGVQLRLRKDVLPQPDDDIGRWSNGDKHGFGEKTNATATATATTTTTLSDKPHASDCSVCMSKATFLTANDAHREPPGMADGVNQWMKHRVVGARMPVGSEDQARPEPRGRAARRSDKRLETAQGTRHSELVLGDVKGATDVTRQVSERSLLPLTKTAITRRNQSAPAVIIFHMAEATERKLKTCPNG
ncbi:hypothetical protein HJFPF1_01588 [Paramyrothecium foliicola]|nr:hypothetical protein HJFPF1_01588 [Paramyrothecium foliicola]